MIASWMLYTIVISILITAAAFGMERVGEARGVATRFAWAGALALSILWPVGQAIARLLPASAQPTRVLPFVIVVQAPTAIVDGASIDRALLVDRGLAALWIAASLILLVRLAVGVRAIDRARLAWRPRSVDGVDVRVSANVGPAVVGLRSMDVVVPEWILSLDAPLRALVLRHEEEHRAARDPMLLFAAAFAVVLMPWNVALWIQARRLRLAIEMDCDARVLRAHPSPERYGMLMLTIAQRRSVAPVMFAPMLSEPTTNLERRILAMRSTTKRLARVTMVGGGVVAVAMLAFASTLQSATSLRHTLRIPVDSPPPLSSGTAVRVRRAAPEENPAPNYPDVLLRAGVEGTATVRFVTDAAGVPDSSSIEVVSATHPLFATAVERVLPRWHLAQNATMVVPFTFVVAGGKTLEAIRAGGGQPAYVIDGVRVQTVLVVGGIRVPGVDAEPGARRGGVPEQWKQPAQPGQSGQPARVGGSGGFVEFKLDKEATPMPGNRGPRYPDAMRNAGIEGEVLAAFVVDTTGLPLMDTFKVLRSTDTLFTNTVRGALADMRFYPAEAGGRKVKQLIQMPFQFNLSKN